MSGSCLLKICGLARTVDVDAAVAAGADYLGFIMAESPRKVTPDEVRAMTEHTPREVPRVGVMVNASDDEIEYAVKTAGLGALQFSGDETPERCEEAQKRYGLPVIKALRLRRQGEPQGIDPFQLVSRYQHMDYILIEPYVEGQYGGTGRTADWPLAAEIVTAFPDCRFFLAGGLTPDNIEEAIQTVRPHGVDVGSGLEAKRRVKDHEKIRLFSEVVKAHDRT